jgi:uncharacterized membrane protein
VTLVSGLLILISAVIHAGWNLLSKRTDPSMTFFLAANILGNLCLAPALLLYGPIIQYFPKETIAWLALTGIFQAVYYLGLSGAYRIGHISIAYPLARSLPVVLVAVANLMLGRSQQLSVQALLGMLLITLGGILLPLRQWSDWRLRTYLSWSAFWALVAALGTVGYSIIDDHALRVIRNAVDGISTSSSLQATIVYSVLEGFSITFWLFLTILTRSQGRVAFTNSLRKHGLQSAAAGFAMVLAYTLVLIAMGFARNVSYVVAFRQVSILLGAVAGVFLLKEPAYPAKFVGVGAMFLGLVLTATG